MKRIFNTKLIFTASVIFIIAFLAIVYYSVAPSDFPERAIVKIKPGQYLSQAADTLEKNRIIKSQFMFKVYVFLISGHRQVRAADYLFDEPQSALRVAYRAVNGIQGLPKIKVTFFEGMTVKSIGATIKKNIPNFDLQTFLVLAKPYEGYLFPDTYFFYENTTPQDVVDQLRATFTEKLKPELLSIQAFGKPIADVITMASIVEQEATSTKDRKIIAGALWHRIAINMPLQVDPPFHYILGKDSKSLTLDDLAIDSPYNLYKHTGLPPTPINNPGLDAIEATIMPTKTDYLFYLSDKNGNMHYAKDHEGHIANRNKYLK